MRINRHTSLLLSAVVALAVAAPAAAQREEGQSPQDLKDQSKERTAFACESGDTVALNADLIMWPPNHKYQDLAVTAEDTDRDGDEISLITSVTHDEYIDGFVPSNDSTEEEQREGELNGSGNTVDDAKPFMAMDSTSGGETATTTHEVRSERSGRSDGRTYTISVNASFDGEDCVDEDGNAPEFNIEVPHDMRSSNAPAAKSVDERGNGNGDG